ncbi:MAG: spermidine/putrescine ABC transporter substrate-binding protein [Clostridium sp.]|jgi:spermidine/putrescine-binding protein|nr:spermidine/putrescine ABC transporter substrate-binding protein [Clostridium sp.]
MKRFLTAILLCALALGLLVSCGGAGSDRSVNLFIWSEYMPQEVLDDFEAETGIKVNITTFGSIADMYAKVKSSPAGTYDLIDAAGFYVKRLIDEGKLDKIDFSNVPNAQNIAEGYKNQNFDPDNEYSVPYLGGVATICVNTARVTEPITSYADLFRPEYEKSIVIIDDFRVIIGAINLMLGFGYDEADPQKLEQTKAKLLELKPNIKVIDGDSPKTYMINGETTLGIIYSAEIAIAMEENPDVEVVYPAEGQYLFFDSLCIAKDSKNKAEAEKFLDYILRPEVGKKIVDIFPYTSPNDAAAALLGEDYLGNSAKNIPATAVAKGYNPVDLDTDTLQIYNDIWTEFTK